MSNNSPKIKNKQKKNRETPIRKIINQDKQNQNELNCSLRTSHVLNNFFSKILETEPYQDNKNLNPEFLRIKNNILLIILCMSSFGIYYLFQGYMNVILLAFIGGIGYQQMRQRFIQFWLIQEPFFQKQMTLIKRIFSIIAYLLLIVLIPFLKSLISNLHEITNQDFLIQISDEALIKYLQIPFTLQKNLIVLGLQLFLAIKVLHLILAPKIFPIISQYAPRSQEFYKIIFALIFLIFAIFTIIVIPSVFLMQVSNGGFWVQGKIQQNFGCQLIKNDNQINLNQNITTITKLPLCTEMFLANNTYLIQLFKQFKAQTSEIQECMTYISSLQKQVIGYEFFHYQQIVCSWFLVIQKAVKYVTPISPINLEDVDVVSTSKLFFKIIFGNITYLIISFSNIIFEVTTFFTIFYITLKYFDPQSSDIQDIFYGQRKQLLSQITNLIQASLFIVVQHFLISIILLQLFDFSYFNMIIATLLSLMAFVPFFRPWFGMLFFCALRTIFIRNYLQNIIFLSIYYWISQKIFSARFKPMKFHQIITNLSILFGIYQFGIAGIVYGPILLILFKSVHRQLLRNQIYNKNESDNMIQKDKIV